LIQKGLLKIRSALFRAYKEEIGSDVMDYLYKLMESRTVIGLMSQLSVPEILRGVTKRKNQGSKKSTNETKRQRSSKKP